MVLYVHYTYTFIVGLYYTYCGLLSSSSSYGITVWFPTYIEHLRHSLNETTPNSTASDKSVLYTEAFIYAAASFPGVAITAIVVDLPYMTRALWLCEF